MSAAVIATPLWVEWFAVRPARTAVVHTGMGPHRSLRAARRLGASALLVAGVAGGLAPHVRVGDLVVASEIRAPDGSTRLCPAAPALVDDLRHHGLIVHYGPIISAPRLADGAGRRRLAETGALAVDMESAWLAPVSGPFAVVRAISDTASIRSPAIVGNGLRALRALRRAVPALDEFVSKGTFLTPGVQQGAVSDSASTEVT